MVEVGGRICQVLGLPRSTGQIFGLLYLSTEPLSLNQMSSMLGISKGSASMGTRHLAAWGSIRKVWVPGDRRDYYEVVEDLGQLIRGSYNNLIKPRIQSSKDRLAALKVNLKEDIQSGAIPLKKRRCLRNESRHWKRFTNACSNSCLWPKNSSTKLPAIHLGPVTEA